MNRTKLPGAFSVFLMICFFWTALFAQQSNPNRLRAERIDEPVSLDGRLDEEVWEEAGRISNFTQRELNEHQPATERTEVAVLYSGTDLYIGIWCFDNDPASIVAQKMQWDFDYGSEDNFEIVLDTYGDRRDAYFFAVNANGSQADALIQDNGQKTNSDWNGVWYDAAQKNEQGWFVEIRIPFSTLKFSAAPDQIWGINFERNIRHKREQVRWQGWSRDASIRQISRAGILEGLSDLPRMGVFEFRPYAVAGAEKERGLRGNTVGDLGLDFSYLVSPTIKLDFTVNPDFAQVESDRLIVNLTRFSISYPEKRQFFLEAQNFFNFPLGRARAFYSRRIGINQGRETPILGGTRFVGKMGRTTLGIMTLQTRKTEQSLSANFSLLRWKQDVGRESSIGILAVGTADSDRFNGTGGMDFLISTSKLFGNKNFRFGGAFAATYTSDRTDKSGNAHRLFFSLPNDLIDFSGSWERAGENFNPEVGFLSRRSYQVFETELSISPRPKSIPWIKQLEFIPLELSYYIDDLTRQMQSVYMEIRPLGFELKSGDAVELNFLRSAENLTESFEISDGFEIPRGTYWSNRGEVQIETFEGRPWVADVALVWGEFYNGSITEWEADLAWKPNRFFSTSLSYQRSDIKLSGGRFAIDEVAARLNFSLTPKLYGSVFSQWNNEDDEILFNLRITWIPKPGAYVYFVFNQFGETRSPLSRWRINTTVAMVKFVWYFSTK